MLGQRRLAVLAAGTALFLAGALAGPADAADVTQITLAANGSLANEYTVFGLADIDPYASISVRPGATLTLTAQPQVTVTRARTSFEIDSPKAGQHAVLDAAALSQAVSADGRTLTIVLPSSVPYPAGQGQLYLDGAEFTGGRASLGPITRTRWATKVTAGAAAAIRLPLRTEIRLPVGSDSGSQRVTPGQKLTLRLPTGDATQTALGDPDLAEAQVTVVEETLDGEKVRYRNADLAVAVATDSRSLTLTVPSRIQALGGQYALRVTGEVTDVSLFEWRTYLAPYRTVKASQVGVMRVDAAGHAVFHLSGPLPRNGGVVGEANAVPFGRRGDIPFVGDWDGNGTATVGVFRPSDGTWYLAGRNIKGGAPVTVVAFGRSTDRPVVGRFGTDPGRTSIGLFRDGTFFLAKAPARGAGTTTVKLGRAGDLPLAGDYDGDGLDETAIYRPSTRTFTFPGAFSTSYGKAGDVPLLQDRTARGYASYGVYRPSTATFVLDVSYRFGTSGDRPFVFTP